MARYHVLVFVSLSLILSYCSTQNNREMHSISGHTMGTTYSIKIVYDPGIYTESSFSNLKYSVDSILADINQQMSTYIKDSEISLFNKYQDTTWFDVSSDFAYVLQRSVDMGKLSGGALDITVGPLVNLWGFGPVHKSRSIPDDRDISEMLKNIGWKNISIDTMALRVKKYNKDIYCDLSSTAKGFAVDKVADYISAFKWGDYLVEIGGEVRAKGKNLTNEFWKIGIAEPNSTSEPYYVVSLNNMAMATSGDYWNYFEQDGVKYSHTIDPRTGYPVNHELASVTVISESCLLADGLATAINVLGPDKGFKFAEENNIAAYFIIRNDKDYFTKQSTGFENMIDQGRKE